MIDSVMRTKWLSIFAGLTMVFSGSLGCSFIDKNYYFQPTVAERAQGCGPVNEDDKTCKDKVYTVADKHIVEFTSDVKTSLRKRMNWARMVRGLSGSFQVLTAAASAVMGATSGNLTTVAALAASSAVIPDLQNIFDAKGLAHAYDDGLALIEDAEARYFVALSGSAGGTVSKDKLTPDGANLYMEVLASLKLVEKALVAKIPGIKELQAATGEYLDKLKVSERQVILEKNTASTYSKAEIHAIKNASKLTVTSSNVELVKGIPDPADNSKIKIETVGNPTQKGSATLTISNANGETAKVLVKVESPIVCELYSSMVAGASPQKIDFLKASEGYAGLIKCGTLDAMVDPISTNSVNPKLTEL